MLPASVSRDQFDVSQYGIVHMPTDATFTPTNPRSGILRIGHLDDRRPNEGGFKPDEVCRLMDELWAEYLGHNPELFVGLRRQHH